MNEVTLRSYLKDRFRGYRDEMTTDADLTGIVDSLGMFELVDFVEQSSAIRIAIADFRPSHFSSIRSILSFVDELKAREHETSR